MRYFAKLMYLALVISCGALFLVLPPSLWKNAALGGAIGGVLGYATNWLVVWMLFHPRKALELPGWMGGFPVPLTPGLMVKKQVDIAASVGKTVSSKLLSPETIRSELQAPETRNAVSRSLQREIHLLAEKTYPPLSQMLDHESLVTLLKAKPMLIERLTKVLQEQLQSPACRDRILEFLTIEMKNQVDEPLKTWIPVSRREAMARWGASQLAGYVRGSEGMHTFRSLCSRIGSSLSQAETATTGQLIVLAHDFLEPEAPRLVDEAMESLEDKCRKPETDAKIRERLTLEVQSFLETALAGNMAPLAMQGLLQEVTRPLVRTHVDKHWDALKEDFFSSRDIRAFATKELKDASERFLLSLKDPETAQTPRAKAFQRELFEILGKTVQRNVDEQEIEGALFLRLERIFSRTVADLFPNWEKIWGLHAEALLETVLFSPIQQNASALNPVLGDVIDNLLFEVPVGKPIEHLPVEDRKAVIDYIVSRGLTVMEESIPLFAKDLSVEKMIRQQIQKFQPEQIETTVREVADRELNVIIILGGYLGLAGGAVLQVLLTLLGSA